MAKLVEKIDDNTVRITETTTIINAIDIKILKRQKQQLLESRDRVNAKIDEINQAIQDAKDLGVE